MRMNNLIDENKMRFFLLAGLLSVIFTTSAQENSALLPSENAPNIISVSNDTIYLTNSTTYAYTVDTPVGEGLVRTGLTVDGIADQLCTADRLPFEYAVTDKYRHRKTQGYLVSGDVLGVGTEKERKNYVIQLKEGALSPVLKVHRHTMTRHMPGEIVLDFIAGQRTPDATVRFYIPEGVRVTPDNTTVNVIGRGEVTLRDLPLQSIGKTGTNYSYRQVGKAELSAGDNGGQILTFRNIDLRPFNGIDIRLRIKPVSLVHEKEYVFRATYTTSAPDVYHSFETRMSTDVVQIVPTVSDFRREMPEMFTLKETPDLYLKPELRWSALRGSGKITLMSSVDEGKSWQINKQIKANASSVIPNELKENTAYLFKLTVEGGEHAGASNTIRFYSGKQDVKSFDVKGDGKTDDTEAINRAIRFIHESGGGILSFTAGEYPVRTIHLKSNVWLHIDKEAVIRCLPGSDTPETTWFSDRAYRSGLSPVDPAPYEEPENYLTKQDVGHTYFHNTMFFAERERNIKIFGNGRITGDGNLVTGDRVMNNNPEKRADKMFVFKLCTQIEIGGYDTGKDMWYDASKDEPYYIGTRGRKIFELDNVLYIDQGGHFVLLATGTDTLNVHDTYFGKYNTSNARDIYDFMACNHVEATNIYSKVSSDDIVKLGSDCSLGFTRPVKGYKVRNIIGDTNCNLFQIGSETADDIQDVYVDNIYVLGSNKAGFSISANDGACVKNIFLNSGYTGKIHSRSMMFRTRAPFFISISNRGRVIGADVKRFRFKENGVVRDELLCTNSNIGSVENIVIKDVDIFEVYAGSSFRGKRWEAYDGTQNEATPIIAGYKLPDPADVEGGLGFTLPDGRHTGYITNITFKGVNLLVKGGHPAEDAGANPPEIGVGRYNVGDLKIQPAYGFWFRHAKDVLLKDCRIRCEKPDARHAIVLDKVVRAKIEAVKWPDFGAEPPIKSIPLQNNAN